MSIYVGVGGREDNFTESVLTPYGSQGWNSGHQAGNKHLTSEPPQWPYFVNMYKRDRNYSYEHFFFPFWFVLTQGPTLALNSW